MPDQVVTQVERVLALKTFEAFRNLSPQELAVLATNARPRFFPRGAALLSPGVPVRTLHFILQGKVRLMLNAEPLLELGPQDVVGGLAALTEDRAGQHALALEDTTTLQLHREDLEDVFEDNFSILLGVLRAMAKELITTRRTLNVAAGFAPPDRSEPVRAVGELGLVEKLFFLRQAMDFAGSRVEALADLAQEAQTVNVAEQTVLWSVGDVAEDALMMISGVIESVSDDGQQHFEFGPGAVVGGIDSLAQEPRWYRALAKTRVLALRIRTQHLLDVVEDNIDLGMDMLRVFAQTLRELQAQIPERPAPVEHAIA